MLMLIPVSSDSDVVVLFIISNLLAYLISNLLALLRSKHFYLTLMRINGQKTAACISPQFLINSS